MFGLGIIASDIFRFITFVFGSFSVCLRHPVVCFLAIYREIHVVVHWLSACFDFHLVLTCSVFVS